MSDEDLEVTRKSPLINERKILAQLHADGCWEDMLVRLWNHPMTRGEFQGLRNRFALERTVSRKNGHSLSEVMNRASETWFESVAIKYLEKCGVDGDVAVRHSYGLSKRCLWQDGAMLVQEELFSAAGRRQFYASLKKTVDKMQKETTATLDNPLRKLPWELEEDKLTKKKAEEAKEVPHG